MTSLLADIKATLEWYNDAGVDEAIEPLPVSRAAKKTIIYSSRYKFKRKYS